MAATAKKSLASFINRTPASKKPSAPPKKKAHLSVVPHPEHKKKAAFNATKVCEARGGLTAGAASYWKPGKVYPVYFPIGEDKNGKVKELTLTGKLIAGAGHHSHRGRFVGKLFFNVSVPKKHHEKVKSFLMLKESEDGANFHLDCHGE